jgi:predicted short-subunit dehydrogenase-like oxidoreductase (DUF2520 family)
MNVKDKIKRVTIVGAGNVGHNFGLAFKQAGYLIHEIYSRTQDSAVALSQRLNCNFTTDLSKLDPGADLYIIAVNDDALPSIIENFPFKDKLIVHTSGATALEVFEGKGFSEYGIFYPVQSFSKEDTESLAPIPICVEANKKENEELLMSFARSLSMKVYQLNSEKRKALHVAAVFANNFSNHMYTIAEELLDEADISFDIIRPLIEKTAKKIHNRKPTSIQTGPAVRNDQKIIQKHLEHLKSHPDYKELYEAITANILKKQAHG